MSNEPYNSFDKESTGQQVAPTETQSMSTENPHRCTHFKREVQKPDITPDVGVRTATVTRTSQAKRANIH